MVRKLLWRVNNVTIFTYVHNYYVVVANTYVASYMYRMYTCTEPFVASWLVA